MGYARFETRIRADAVHRATERPCPETVYHSGSWSNDPVQMLATRESLLKGGRDLFEIARPTAASKFSCYEAHSVASLHTAAAARANR